MESSSKTAHELFEDIERSPMRIRFGFGAKPIPVNIDLQNSCTKGGAFATAYKTDPAQLDHVSMLVTAFHKTGLPMVWAHGAHRVYRIRQELRRVVKTRRKAIKTITLRRFLVMTYSTTTVSTERRT